MRISVRSDNYQYSLIALGVIATAFFGVFFYREIFPEYKIYQEDYIALEKFRSTYTHEEPPAFNIGVKQILIEPSDKGNAIVDRCISCHVAVQFPHFSETKVAFDINGQMLVDDRGRPVLIPNEDYIWGKLDKEILALEDGAVNSQLVSEGRSSEVAVRKKEAEKLKALKIANVGEHTYDVTKVLAMHPLMGKETRAFEYHPIEEYGCTSCHSGNGRGLTTAKAHGPVFDDQYEQEFMGHVPIFTESDDDNDPRFAKMFNGRPGAELLFQTEPILIGPLIQAKCAICHTTSKQAIESVVDIANRVTEKKLKQQELVRESFDRDRRALIALYDLSAELNKVGSKELIAKLKEKANDFSLVPEERKQAAAQLAFISSPFPLEKIQKVKELLIGSPDIANSLFASLVPNESDADKEKAIDEYLSKHQADKGATGTLFAKFVAMELEKNVEQHIKDIEQSFAQAVSDDKAIGAIASEIDLLTYNYSRGQRLFVSQGCFACHRIAGYTRGGVGPELTYAGQSDPWFIKQSIVWPQADLATSTMPNFGLDHEEIQDLMTFLLGQEGQEIKTSSEVNYKSVIQEWEAGRKLPWEKPISPLQMKDVDYGMKVFATEGCASCHRLEGYQANVGFAVEKDKKASFDEIYAQKEWFRKLFPEQIMGSQIVEVVDANFKQIDERIVDGVRSNTILEEIEKTHPKLLESFYTPFKFAKRVKNHHYKELIAKESDESKKQTLKQEQKAWHDRIERLMLIYAQEYGVGRFICPKPNWSGIFRTDEWLMEHFKNPSSHTPKSLMPVFPFDDTKFYALTYMLDVIGMRNRGSLRAIWKNNGFNPALAFELLCAQCHGDFLQGNGPVGPWIYPIPKNLRSGEFLRNLTKEQVIASITHGVKGTPMPPWGEIAKDKPIKDDGGPMLTKQEIAKLADWIFSSLPGSNIIRGSQDVPKWHYNPEDVLKELEDEGGIDQLKEGVDKDLPKDPLLSINLRNSHLIASLEPVFTGSKENAAQVSDIFDVYKDKDGEKSLYRIKKKFYTKENLQQARQFFELNCAVCHGKEADGTGMRAGTMIEAKPRMLTNLDWIKTHDDLRLLRSIKYGVAGTSMTPWGDLTSSLQRIQLVMFIRTLSENRFMQDSLMQSLYSAFDTADLTIEHARAEAYAKLIEERAKYQQVRNTRDALYSGVNTNSNTSKQIMALYETEQKLLTDLKKSEGIDALFVDLKLQVKQEKELYMQAGHKLLQQGNDKDIANYNSLISKLNDRFKLVDGAISYNFSPENETAIETEGTALLKAIDAKIDELKEQKKQFENLKNQEADPLRLRDLNSKLQAISNLKNTMITALTNGRRIREKEQKTIEEINRDK